MNIAIQALGELYPDIKESRQIRLKYHGKFKGYNANIRWSHQYIEIRLSNEWKDVSDLIQIGLIQHLLIKLYKIKKQTDNMSLYESFIKNLSKLALVNKQDPELSKAFDELNGIYFSNHLEKSNLVWGNNSFHKLGSYTYASDTITISNVFRDLEPKDRQLMHYILYHEMLHKHHSFTAKNGQIRSHTKAFRDKEKEFKLANAEEKLHAFLRKKKRGKEIRKGFLTWFVD